MDLNLGDDLYESFVNYQTKLINELDKMSQEYGFIEIDAGREPQDAFLDIKNKLKDVLEEQAVN